MKATQPKSSTTLDVKTINKEKDVFQVMFTKKKNIQVLIIVKITVIKKKRILHIVK